MFKFTRRKALTDTNFVALDTPICNSPWTGMAPFTTHLSAIALDVSTSVTDAQAQLTLMPKLVPGPSSSANPAPLPNDRLHQNTGLISQNSLLILDPPRENLLSPSCIKETPPASLMPPRCSAASSTPVAAGNTEAVPTTTLMFAVAHRKRRHDAEKSYVENHEGPPRKRVRGEASGGMMRSWRQRSPWTGTAVGLRPGSQQTVITIHLRRQGAKQKCSRP